MFTLNYNDLTDNRTFTYGVMSKREEEIKALENRLARLKAFDLALYNYLQTHKTLNIELYNYAVVYLEHTDKNIADIFEEIRKGA